MIPFETGVEILLTWSEGTKSDNYSLDGVPFVEEPITVQIDLIGFERSTMIGWQTCNQVSCLIDQYAEPRCTPHPTLQIQA